MRVRKAHRTILEDAIAKIGEGFSEELSFPGIWDREFWDKVSSDYRKAQIEAGEKAQKEPWEMLLSSDYLEFSRNGNRENFEKKYFSRRLKLTTLVLSECMENQGRFFSDIIDGLYLILEETSWCLPAHNSYIRDEKQFPLPCTSRPVLDLFAAESGAILGLLEYLLRPKLRAISPFISEYVEERLWEKILKPYLSYHFWWMGDGESPMLNWTPWITQNVLLTAFTRDRSRENVRWKQDTEKILKQAALSLDYFLDEYGEDGCCSEGAEYYGHAGLCLFGAVDLMNRLSGGGLNSVFHTTLLYNMGNYIVNMYVSEGRYFNFADCSPYAGKRSGRDYFFAKATGNGAYRNFAIDDYLRTGFVPDEEDGNGRLLLKEENLYYHLLQIMADGEIRKIREGKSNEPESIGEKSEKIAEEAKGQYKEAFYESVGLFITEDNHYSLAVKAGNNADAHNHNDTGSCILYKNGEPLLIDLGVETYTEKTFSDRRYAIWTMQSKYHNLPSFYLRKDLHGEWEEHGDREEDNKGFREILQGAGAQYSAKDLRYSFGKEESFISMDIADAYPGDIVRKYLRSVRLRKNKAVLLEDSYEGEAECRLSLLFSEEPELDAKNARILLGERAVLSCTGVAKLEKERLPIRDSRLRRAWKEDCWRAVLYMKESKISIEIQ